MSALRTDRSTASATGLDRPLIVLSSVVVLGAIMSILDTTIVNVALDSLGRELRAPLSSVQWVATGYLLALSIVIPLSGWAMDRFGVKPLWMGSVALFLIGSAACGAAWSISSLVVFRVLQGLGGGMIMPVGMSILAQAAGPQRVGRVMSVIGVPMMLGPVIGPVLGGVLVQDASWRWIFYVNVPIGALALLLAARILPAPKPMTHHRLDARGLALLSPGLALLVYGLSEAGSAGGFASPTTVGGVLAGAALIGLFVVHAGRRGDDALLDVRLFRDRVFAAGAATSFLFGIGLFGAMILLPLYYQIARGQGALTTGLLLAPQGIGAALAMPVSGRLSDRLGPGRVVPFGLAILLVGSVAFAFVTAHTSYVLLSAALVVRGLGMGGSMMPAFAAAYGAMAPAAVPRATTSLNIIQRIGGSLGTAFLAVLLQREIHTGLHLPSSSSGLAVLGSIPPSVHAAVADRLAHAFAMTFWMAFALIALAYVPALFLPRRPVSGDAVAGAPAAAPVEV